MKKILIKNIKELVQVSNDPVEKRAGEEMSHLETVRDAYLLIVDGYIEDFGRMADLDDEVSYTSGDVQHLDASGKLVLPCWCDSHTHLVYPASRETEFVDRIKGLSYEEIARRGGGILNSARKMETISEKELYDQAFLRLKEISSYGTGAVEIKSGYGLTVDAELKMLRVIRQLKASSQLTVRATFLGAHAVPVEYRGRQEQYVDKVINEMLPRIAGEGLADFVDVFCDRGFFSVDDTARILAAAARYGLRPKIHANELDYSGGIQTGVRYQALSVDHLEHTGEEEIAVLQGSDTMPVVLPGAAFFLGLPPAPVRKMIDAGLPLALASDFNPGSAPSGNMQFILSLGCIIYKMTPEEAIHAVTLNGAYAMGVEKELGSITRGKKANVFITKEIPSYSYMPYSFGDNKVKTVILNGEMV